MNRVVVKTVNNQKLGSLEQDFIFHGIPTADFPWLLPHDLAARIYRIKEIFTHHSKVLCVSLYAL